MTAEASFVHGQVWARPRPNLLRRIADGIRALDWPAECRYQDSIRGYSHAHHVMAIHARHRCPRYRMADDYAAKVRP